MGLVGLGSTRRRDLEYGAWLGFGCVYGRFGPSLVSVEFGGPVLDGGCLGLRGH